jgi:hypothetical protein
MSRSLTWFFGFLVDPESAVYQGEEVGDRITSESNIVGLFGVWNKYARRSDRSLPFTNGKPTGKAE